MIQHMVESTTRAALIRRSLILQSSQSSFSLLVDNDRLVTSRAARALVVRLGELIVEAEVIRGLEDVGVVARAEDLALVALPLGLVDGVDPVLDLHDDAAVLLDGAWAGGDVEETLGLLEGEGAYESKSVGVCLGRTSDGKSLPFWPPQE